MAPMADSIANLDGQKHGAEEQDEAQRAEDRPRDPARPSARDESLEHGHDLPPVQRDVQQQQPDED